MSTPPIPEPRPGDVRNLALEIRAYAWDHQDESITPESWASYLLNESPLIQRERADAWFRGRSEARNGYARNPFEATEQTNLRYTAFPLDRRMPSDG